MRKWKRLGALAALVVLVVGAFVAWPRSDRITRENYDHIRMGMSRAEVEAIPGPSGDYATGPCYKPIGVMNDPGPSVMGECNEDSLQSQSIHGRYSWETHHAAIYVKIGPNDACVRTFYPAERMEQPILDNLRWRAKRQ
jgi:hypothetical protein